MASYPPRIRADFSDIMETADMEEKEALDINWTESGELVFSTRGCGNFGDDRMKRQLNYTHQQLKIKGECLNPNM